MRQKNNRRGVVGGERAIARMVMTIGVTILMGGMILPSALEAQGPPPGEGRRGGMGPGMGGSVAFLLEKSDDLTLSAEQKEGLEALASELRETNQGVMAKMRAARESGDRSAMQEVRTSIQANDAASLEKAMVLLDATQKETAQKLLDSRPARRRGPPG